MERSPKIPKIGDNMKRWHHFVYSILLLMLSSCTPYQPWLKNVFFQGENVDQPTALVRQYLRTEHVYDQFSTLGHFSAIWLADEVRIAYARIYSCKFCYNNDQYLKLLQTQKVENNNYISFYLLTATPTCYDSLLSDKDPEWATCLIIDNKRYDPLDITQVELPPEYALFFGKTYTRFKNTFFVRFPAQTAEGPIIKSDVSQFALVFSRADRKVYLTWFLDKRGNVIRMDVKKDPDVLFYDLECCP